MSLSGSVQAIQVRGDYVITVRELICVQFNLKKWLWREQKDLPGRFCVRSWARPYLPAVSPGNTMANNISHEGAPECVFAGADPCPLCLPSVSLCLPPYNHCLSPLCPCLPCLITTVSPLYVPVSPLCVPVSPIPVSFPSDSLSHPFVSLSFPTHNRCSYWRGCR